MTTTWNPSDKDAAITLTNSNKTATQNTTSDAWRGVRGTAGFVATGKKYFEATVTTLDGSNGWIIGISNPSAALNAFLGSSGFMLGFQTNRTKWANNVSTTLAWKGAVSGDVLGIAIDFANKLAWIENITSDAGVWNNGTAGTQNPGTGAGGIAILATLIDGASTVFPHWTGVRTAGSADAATINTGNDAASFTGTIPSGFTAWDGSVAASGGAKDAAVCVISG